jgi:hypothetical protein
MRVLLMEIEPRFAGYSAGALATLVAKNLPLRYSGTIYLNGCDTGRRRGYVAPGTSYIELFGAALAKVRDDVTSLVFGSLGGAATVSEDTERVEIEKKLYDLLLKKSYSGLDERGGKYYIYGIAGQAFYDMSAGAYGASALDVIGDLKQLN